MFCTPNTLHTANKKQNRTLIVLFYPSNFNGKEKNRESGFHYYGARYMDHELMTMWLSVDRMAELDSPPPPVFFRLGLVNSLAASSKRHPSPVIFQCNADFGEVRCKMFEVRGKMFDVRSKM